ncbi:ESPR-type extended signal peptide-containing protein [Megamonas hypermegale]|uniref:ESPR-type extended signal peptide-containing protein n=1 Tax=Megamonas hypermegale TaxID=158847 RepID=UPI0026EBBAA8|nr:ESPR-type extended signal peptide-containing protein [Megamonas hypermegale]
MNRIYKVVWNAARGCYVVGSELISCHSREKSGRLAKIKISALILGAVCGFSLSSLPSICAAENVQHEEIAAETAKYDEKTAEAILLRLTGRANRNVEQKSTADTAELKENTDEEALKAANSEPQPEETTTLADGTLAQHSTHDENGYYVHNGDTYNSLTKDGLWVGGTDDSSGFHVDKDGNVTTTGTAQFKQGASTGGNKITDVADGKIEADSTDAVNGGQLAAYVAGELNYTGEGAVSVKDRTISVNTGEGLSVDEDELTLALKENGNLVFDTDGNLTLKDSITVGAVNIDSVKIDDNTVTGLSNTAWTGDNIVNDRATTEGQLKQALENLDLNDISMTVDGEERSLQSVGIIPGSTEKSDQTYAKEAIAIGHSATATGDYSTALGSATANGDYSTALGPEAKANKNYSMALGYGSVADEENVISVGNTNQYRRIVNVADGTGEHEAVTFGQMNTLISGNRTSSDINLDNGATNLVDGINKNTSAIEQLDKSNEITWDNLQTATQNVDNLTQKVSAFAAQTENVDWNALNSVD